MAISLFNSEIFRLDLIEIKNSLLNSISLETNNIIKAGLSILIGACSVYLSKIWYAYGYFKRIGVQTPKYKFIYGNLHEILEKVNFFNLFFHCLAIFF
jgi:hypothetical protein